MKHVFLSILFLVGAFAASAQTTYFEPVSSAQARLAAPIVQDIQKYAIYQLKESALRSYLAKAPLEFTGKGAALLLDIPLPNGTVETFAMLESPILAPAIAARHPEIKTYSGTSTTHKDYTIRLSLTPSGFDAIILGVGGDAVYYTKASADRASRLYLTYFAHDVKKSKTAKPTVGSGKCGSIESVKKPDNGGRKGIALNNTGTTLRTFRLGVAATGEFTKQAVYGGDVNAAYMGVIGYVNRMNAVYARELSVAFTLVSDVNLVFPDPATDPYTNTNQITMLDENQVKLDQVLTNTGYDVGHVISFEGGSGGGVAQSSSVCDASRKAKGVSGVGNGSFAPIFDDQLLSHEIGHQFSMNHSFNSSLPVCTTREAKTSVEPGAGVTIMSYGFTCSDNTGNDNYETPAYAPFLNFHTANYQEAATFINTLTCFSTTALTNVVPVIGTFPAATTIPKSTPFALTGTATDADAANALSYSWEGTNIGTMIPNGTTLANTAQPPFFRSYQPVATGTRTFPRLSAILNGTNYAKGDKLPSVAIATTHRLTVRDNAGGLIYQEVTVTIDGNSGPFLETTNLTGSYPGSSVKTITWDVANTTAAPINCANVDILLSTDGGMTFPTTLLANTPNDGSEPITLPAVLTSTARIKVAGSNTIFFDISNANFSIVAPAVPVVSLTSPDPSASEASANPGRGIADQRVEGSSARGRVGADADPGSLRFERSSSVGELVVKYSLGGTATNGTDYVGLPGSLTFADGESVRDVPVTPIDDDEVEGDEDAVVTLTDEAAYDPDPAHTTGTVTIKENDTAPFSITGVTTVSCTTISAGQRQLTFNPRYAGTNGQTITFRVVNELSPTTNPGPYTLNPYTDNPVFTLKATQAGSAGEASFTYDWLAACNGGGTPPTNTAPTTTGIANQTATVGQAFSLNIASSFSDAETPNDLTFTASGLPAGLSLSGSTISGTPSMSGVSTVSVTATDPGSLSVSTQFMLTVNPATVVVPPTSPFSITGVTTVSCTTISAGQRQLTFNPQYAGTNGQPITFSVVNELSPTTNPGPYTLNPYIDNPSFTLKATQAGSAGEASFTYNWLAACNGGGTPPTNTAPTTTGIANQTATVGQAFSLNIASSFSDAETPNGLTFTASGLPAGLSLMGSTISGTPSMSGVSTVTVTATDPGNLSVSTQFMLTVNPATVVVPPSGPFSITGVATVSCTTISAGQRQLTFNPQYAGTNGQTITFSVVNELSPTTNPGPYTLNPYTDNPVFTLKATQAGSAGEASFTYNWLAACNSNGARLGAEPVAGLDVRVLGNPTQNGQVSVEVRGAAGQPLQVNLTTMRGQTIGSRRVETAGLVERHTFEIDRQSVGQLLLRVSTSTQSRTVKVLKVD